MLSSDDAERVRAAAADQIRDGSYNNRFKEQRCVHIRGLALLPETRTEYARRADRLRRGAIHTCPHCLYSLAGVLVGELPMPCPECGEEVSFPGNTLIWGERAIKATYSRLISHYAGLAVGGLYFIALSAEMIDILSGPAELLWIIAACATFGLPIGVPFAAYEWLKRRHPITHEALIIVASIFVGLVNTAAALLVAFIAIAIAESL